MFRVCFLLATLLTLSQAYLIMSKVLVLGGTGYVGKTVVKELLSKSVKVVSVSRRGSPGDADDSLNAVDWRCGDVTDPTVVKGILKEGNFDGVVHAVGMLFQGKANKLVSGSGSVPTPGTTYDALTRQTAVAASDALAATGGKPPKPFVFVSAAEAGWTIDSKFKGTPLEWLHNYLIAKRAVESHIGDLGQKGLIRPVIVRPSLIWDKSKIFALGPVGAFTLGNAIGLPFVDKPVNVHDLSSAVVKSLYDPSITGILKYQEIEAMAKE
ncbi:unnamed protein product [Chrysoparadoxa australica]